MIEIYERGNKCIHGTELCKKVNDNLEFIGSDEYSSEHFHVRAHAHPQITSIVSNIPHKVDYQHKKHELRHRVHDSQQAPFPPAHVVVSFLFKYCGTF